MEYVYDLRLSFTLNLPSGHYLQPPPFCELIHDQLLYSSNLVTCLKHKKGLLFFLSVNKHSNIYRFSIDIAFTLLKLKKEPKKGKYNKTSIAFFSITRVG